ncbi:MAG: cytidylate kinase-like family protein [Treponema sp.]|nr:cytidylate kinase-like family protein [Treponema sp.]
MKKIITISREYGSGGRTIGELVAKILGYKFYDKELIDMAAKESGLSPDFIEKTEQNISSGWLYNLLLGASYATNTTGIGITGSSSSLPLADQIFNTQRAVIKKIAKEDNCVIVGRCADYILKNSKDIDQSSLFNVFIYANLDDKLERSTKKYNVPEDKAKELILQIDKRRANHYNTFTDKIWGRRENYDLLINSSVFGIEGCANVIANLAKNN